MRTVVDLQFNVTGQSIYLDVPEGRPSSVTSVVVYRAGNADDGLAESATTGSASVETNPNTTTDAACGQAQSDPQHVPVTATTGFVADRDYLITDTTTGVREWIEVVGITSGDSVDVRIPLHNNYASGSSVVSTRISIAIDSTWIADRARLNPSFAPDWHYRVRWVYVVSGVTYVADSYFNVVRYPGHAGITPEDVDSFLPGWLDRLPTDYQADQGRRLIDEAYREVKLDLAAAEVDDSALADSEIVDELTRCKAVQMAEWARYMVNNGDGDRHLSAAKAYGDRLASFVTLAKRIMERNAGGGAIRRPAIGISRR